MTGTIAFDDPASPALRVRIASSRDRFERAGSTWFPLSDTIWSAFTHVPEPEWERYVGLRAAQGFTALNISILPILHDLSDGGARLPEPFEGLWEGRPRFGELLPAYRRHASAYLDVATAHGLVPNLVVLWCNYVPDTWASTRDPRFVMDAGARRDFVESMADAFDRYNPMYVIAGDADFASESSRLVWSETQRHLVDLVPDAVTTMHTQDSALIPDLLADEDALGYYCYQSGHQLHNQNLAWDAAEHYARRRVRRPVLNLEPCYEGHGHGFGYGRFAASDVRRASWQSLLSGASAGLGYGAHGVWQWHHRGARFNHAEFSAVPFDRWTALAFPGADDVVAAARMMHDLGLIGAGGRQDLLAMPHEGVRAAVGDDPRQLAVYVPAATDVALMTGLEVEGAVATDLATGKQAEADIDAYDGPVLRQPEWNADTLFVVRLGSTR